MKSAIFTSESDKDLKLLLELAKKLGIKTKVLSKEEYEDLGLKLAMDKGKIGEFVDTEKFLKSLK
ncbi:MAG: hypothetical protein EA412_08935 [Chitinophagaceae bacterium]|nr:MAG: hypothetical protein EA412_08935 [Chitinophagaceae bacterium]